MTKLEELTSRLTALDDAYYNQDTQLIPDIVYDALVAEYTDLTGQEWVRFGSVTKGARVKHSRPMLSLKKIHSEEELIKELPETDYYIVSPKIDGMALSLRYVKGKLVRAVTRGNGTEGEDVTQNALLTNIPKQLTEPISIEIRGEAFIDPEQLDELNQIRSVQEEGSQFVNHRNAIGGLLRSLTPTSGLPFIQFVAYSSDQVHNYYTQMLSQIVDLGIPAVRYQGIDHFQLLNMSWDSLQILEDYLTSSFAVDGLVIRVNSEAVCNGLGEASKYPRYALALKFMSEVAVSTITDIEWSATRTGRIVPVYVFEPVQLNDTTVSRATGHNYQFVQDLGAQVGDRIKIVKSGDIIPKVIGRVE